jgi:hypothetical protein
MIPRILLDSFALRLVYRINTYLDSNPHTNHLLVPMAFRYHFFVPLAHIIQILPNAYN